MVSLPYTRFVACLHRIFFITAYYAVRSRQRVKYCRDRRVYMPVHWRSQGGGGGGTPRNWVHKKIPGCAVEQIHKIVHGLAAKYP